MTFKFPWLNGWIRLYIVAVALWAVFLSYLLYTAMPIRASDCSMEHRAAALLTEEIDRILRARDPIERFQAADGFCDRWYFKASEQMPSANKNQCLEFLVATDRNVVAANAHTLITLRAPFQKELVRELREARDSQFRSDLGDLLPHFAVQFSGGAAGLLAIGFLSAWVRRGFGAGKQA